MVTRSGVAARVSVVVVTACGVAIGLTALSLGAEAVGAAASNDPAVVLMDARASLSNAAAVLAAVERLKKESASHEILRQVAPKGPTNEASKTPPPPPVPALPPSASPRPGNLEKRVGPPSEDAATKYRQLMTVRGQQLTQEVNNAVVDSRKIGADDPDAGVLALKRAENAVSVASDIEPQVRDQLTRRLRSTMQELRTIKERQTVEKVKNAERLAQVESRRKSLEQMSSIENRLTELIDQVRALLVQARHGDDNAYEQAESVAREAINLNPGSGPATQALYNSEMGGQVNKAYRLRTLRADRLLETLYLVELSHVPFPDEPPIEWPNAQVWRALTARRKKWAQTDLRVESKTEARISAALDSEAEFTIEPEPLKDAIEFIAQRYQIPIMLDAKTLEDASIDTSSEVKLAVPGIKLRNVLKLLLEELPQPLTYVIEDEVMKITTVDKANEKLQIRMYPVGDLVMGPQQLMMMSRMGGGGMGGMGGGMSGGAAGGMGGMGGGGMGGGGGGVNVGVGGGMFSVPSEVFPPQAPKQIAPASQPRPAAAVVPSGKKSATVSPRGQDQVVAQSADSASSSSFTNESVQARKKKLNAAR